MNTTMKIAKLQSEGWVLVPKDHVKDYKKYSYVSAGWDMYMKSK
jgi:hypothetical protein